MPKSHKIAVIPGDGIGPEVVREGLRILERVAAIEGFGVALTRYPFGAEHYLKTRDILPDSAFEEIRGHDAILLGAIGDPRIQVGLLEFGIIARMRFGLDLYVNLRPVKLYAEHLCPLKDKKPEHVDFIVVRENTEDAYAGMYGYFKKGNNRPIAAFYYGVRHTTANKAINKPEDMKGLKLRVPDAPLYVMYPKSVGAQATPIAFAEVYLALQNKTVDAQENPLPTILAKKFYEVQTHINLTGHITEMLLAIVGGHVWSKLSDADKKVFVDTFQAAAERSNAEIVASEEKLATEFSTVYKKTVVKSDRAAFQKVFVPFHTGPDATWDKALYDKVQAIK